MPGIEQRQPAFQFGVFEINPHTRELRKHGIKIKLQDQPLLVLLLLLENPGEVVTREEIQKRLWPEATFVDFDNAINSAVRKLRDALGDAPENPRFIETLARRGYRFVSPVTRAGALNQAAQEQSPGVPQLPASTPMPPARAKSKRLLWSTAILLGLVGLALAAGLRLWLKNTEGGSADNPLPPVPLTANPGYEAFPSFSPEGTRVAYAWEPQETHGLSIYVKLIGPGEPVRLTFSPDGDFGPAWSPDGRLIAFLRAHGPTHAVIMIIPALGGPERRVAEITFETEEMVRHLSDQTRWPAPYLTWSADGKWLLTLDQNSPNLRSAASIVRVSVETGEKFTVISAQGNSTGERSPTLSPDGKTLAFIQSFGLFERDIYIAPVSPDMMVRDKPRRLTFDGTDIDGLGWTADSRRLLFSSRRGGRRELWSIAMSSPDAPVRLTAGDDPHDLAISPQGHRLVYSHVLLNRHIWRVSLRGKSQLPASDFISSTRVDDHPAYSPDGTRIAFESSRSGNPEIWTCNADGSGPVRLTSFHAWTGSPRWSPDGRKITFDSAAAGKWDIYVIGSEGGKPTQVTRAKGDQGRPRWSRDGKWIYFNSNETGRGETWKIPANGGQAVQVTKHGGLFAFESLDGQDLYYWRQRQNELWRVPTQGGEEVRVLTLTLSSFVGNSFAPAKRGVYFIDRADAVDPAPSVKFLDFATHAVKTIALIPGPVFDEISVSPDEQWLLYQRSSRPASELMLVENFH